MNILILILLQNKRATFNVINILVSKVVTEILEQTFKRYFLSSLFVQSFTGSSCRDIKP